MKIITFWVPVFIILFFAFKFFISGEKEFERQNIKVDNVIEISDLFITKITASKVKLYHSAEAILKIRGNIYYYVDLNNINLNNLKNKKYVVISKPKFDIELDERKTGIFIGEDDELPKSEIFNYSERASEVLNNYAKKPKNMNLVRKEAEEFIIGYLKQLGYTVKNVYWADLTKENLSKETLNNINVDVLSKLIRCNAKNQNKLKKINLRYIIKRNGGIDPLILSKNVDKKFGDCFEKSSKEIKHKKYYGRIVKIQKSFNLDNKKMCKSLAKNIFKLTKGAFTAPDINKMDEEKLHELNISNDLISESKNYYEIACKYTIRKLSKKFENKSFFEEKKCEEIKAQNGCLIKDINIKCVENTKKSKCNLIPQEKTNNSFKFCGSSRGEGFGHKGELIMEASCIEICK